MTPPSARDASRKREPASPSSVLARATLLARRQLERVFWASVPPDFLSRPLEEQRIITSITLILHSTLVVLAFFFVWYARIHWLQAAACFLPAVLSLVGIAAVRAGKTLLTMHGVLFGMLFVLDFFTLTTGGQSSTTPMWFAAIPLLAMTLLPLRAGVLWAIVMFVHHVVILWVYKQGWYSWMLVPRGFTGFGEFAAAFIAGPLVVGTFSYWGARSRDTLAAKLEKTQSVLQMVLDVVPTGFLIVDRNCCLTQDPSLGELSVSRPAYAGDSLVELLCSANLERGARFAIAFDALVEEALPLELLLEQMPSHWQFNGRDLRVRYHLVYDRLGEPWTRLALTISDVTDARRRQRDEQRCDTLARIVHLLQTERDAFLDFVQESERVIALLGTSTQDEGWLRALHTLKGNAAVFGLLALSNTYHNAEQLALAGSRQAALKSVTAAWTDWQEVFQEVTAYGGFDGVRIDEPSLRAFEVAVRSGVDYAELLSIVSSWTDHAVGRELERVAGRAAAVAERLGKPVPMVFVDAGNLRVDRERWRPLWAAMIHLVRNAVDHGFETSDVRVSAGKSPQGTLSIRASVKGDQLVIEVSDDGAGIDWERVRYTARQQGLDVTEERSLAWLLADGVTTREVVDEVSGRGIGLAAVAEAVYALEGTLDVMTKRGRGTTWRIAIPVRNMRPVDEQSADDAKTAAIFDDAG